jgi:hypothetical protein
MNNSISNKHFTYLGNYLDLTYHFNFVGYGTGNCLYILSMPLIPLMFGFGLHRANRQLYINL